MRLGIKFVREVPVELRDGIHFTAVHLSPATTGHAPWSEPGSNVYASVSDQNNTASPATLRTGTPPTWAHWLHRNARVRVAEIGGFFAFGKIVSAKLGVAEVHEHGRHPLPPALGAEFTASWK